MKKVSGIVTKPAEKLESDKAKRVYRAALDIIRRLDDIIKQKKAYRDVFLPEAIGLRNRLKDYCERLMFYDPVEYGRKAEELLWRKVYYDIIQLMKQNRRTTRLSNAIESAFRTHLSSATGYYHHLLFRLQVEFGLKLEGIVDFHYVPEPRSYKKNALSKKNDQDTKRIETWATRACHRCLVYLGDIARYQQEFDGYRSVILSRRYYYQALAMFPDIGVPHNQLGTLAGTSYCNIVAGYHYLRCLMCSSTFEGAHSNVNRLFEKNRKRYQEVIRVSPRGLPPVHQRLKAIKRCLVRFMHLLDTLQNVTQSDPKELQEYCQNTLQDFNLCMFYTPQSSMADDMYVEKPQYLSDDLVFKIVLMTMISIYQLQQTGSKQVTAAIAFNLALFSHILNHAVIRLQTALYEAENPRKVLELEDDILTSSSEEDVPLADEKRNAVAGENVDDGNHENKTDIKSKNKKSKLAKMRRRRRRDSDQNDLDSVSTDSDLSEGGDSSDLMTDSDEDDDLQYLDSSSSQSDHDDLMESQELPPGFALKGLSDKDDIWAKSVIPEETVSTGENSGNDDYQATSVPNGYTLATEAGEFMLDSSVTDYLSNFSSDFLLSSASLPDPFWSLKFGHFGASQNGADEHVCQEVAQGKKQVRVPPGFDQDPETKHVVEITEKLAAFVIDTDTDTSMLATDTENGSDSETVQSDKGSVIDNYLLRFFKSEHIAPRFLGSIRKDRFRLVESPEFSGSKQVTAAIAFNLALFSHILNHAVIRLQTALYEAENPRKVLELEDDILTSSSEEDVPLADEKRNAVAGENVDDGNHENKTDIKSKNKKSKLAKMRRRRRRDSDQNDLDSVSTDSDLSEGGDSSDLMTDSDEDDDLQYLDSSSSQSDHDDLMESQELPPGFALKGLSDKDDIWAKSVIPEETVSTGENSGNDDYPATSVTNGYTLATEAGEFMLDSSVTDYLSNFSSDFLLSSASLPDPFWSLKFGHFGASQNGADEHVCQEVAQGKKQVRVPPGFDQDPETKHVVEITEKLAAFVIDTDTDTSMLATDTENGSDSETVQSDKGSVIDKNEEEQKRLERMIDVIAREGLLPTIKIFCDWMKCHPHIVTACAQSSQSLWSRLSVLLNLLPVETNIATAEICENAEVRSMVEKAQGRTWVQVQPLEEDLNTQGLSFLKGTQKTMAFDVRKRMDITEKEEALIRICCLRKFGYNMAKMKNISLSYDPEKGMFYGPLQLAAQQDQKEAQEKMVDAETKRNQLMRDMAQLRLQAEVSQLEGSLQSSDQQPSFPLYLVPDTSVLCEKLTLLRQMNNSARFIIIIPLAVIDDLDHLKKESHGAREAIRWLEAEFRKGNRYVRAQKNNERCSNAVPRHIKKKDKDAWHFIQLVDCYKYMAQQSTECDPKAMVAILTNYNLSNSDVPPRVQQAITTAQQEGIDIQNVDDFHAKWKELWKSKG
ncbi:protein SMG5 [Lingula anatina]|uniref:Protein SMG5 n=1 Tax=Lingula anatina TaxID=7574 RepID=A0A1S3HTI9_LINAN|nr:protein SMG5 [Lingula anatina]|eukprot:XP_013389352.1 protein SMG5 [Lingula anatina]